MFGRLGCMWLVAATMYLLSAFCHVCRGAGARFAGADHGGRLAPGAATTMARSAQEDWLHERADAQCTGERRTTHHQPRDRREPSLHGDRRPDKDNELHLPGLTVRPGQRQQLTDWLARLREGGEDAVTGAAGAFGLTAKQFVVLHDAVKPAIAFETKGKLVRDVVKQIVDRHAGHRGNRLDRSRPRSQAVSRCRTTCRVLAAARPSRLPCDHSAWL